MHAKSILNKHNFGPNILFYSDNISNDDFKTIGWLIINVSILYLDEGKLSVQERSKRD